MTRFRIIGHRGGGVGRSENTLASYRQAIRDGADAVELDVRLGGGELVLFHDLSKRKDPEKLAEVLARLGVPVVLHLKRAWFNPWHDRTVLDLISRVTHHPGITVSSFWPGTLTYAKRQYPKLRTGFITYWAGWDLCFARRLGVSEFHVWHRSITPRAITAAKRKSVDLIGFNAPWERRTVISQPGIRGVITDYVGSYVRKRRVNAAGTTKRRT